MSKRKSGKFRGYWRFLAIYSALLIVIMGAGLLWVYGMLKDYESGMPDNAMSQVLTRFSADNAQTLVMENASEISQYEKLENVVEYMASTLSDAELSYVRKSGEFTSENPVYIVKAGKKNIAKVVLEETGKNSHGFAVWNTKSITFGEFVNKDNNIVITAPSQAKVTINGKAADDSIIEQKDAVVEVAKNVGDYVAVPTNTVYKVSGLMAEPEITAELNGAQLTVKADDNNAGCYTAAYPTDEKLLEEQAKNIKNINEEYGKYIINRGSLTRLKSYMVGNAKNYVSDIPAVWAFLWGKEYTYEFTSNEISNFVKYSDDCFSCDAHFDLYVKWNTGNKTYDTNLTYVFIRKSGKWYLADFAIN